MQEDAYRLLARRLDALPNGFPATPDGAELRLLARLFTPAEATLAAQLRITLETPETIAVRTGADPATLRTQLKSMARRGLIKAGRPPVPLSERTGLGYGLMPFVVGIYEAQGDTIDAELARLFEDYYRQAFAQTLLVEPQVHRVIPVQRTIDVEMAVHPYESAAGLLAANRAWGVTDCICRKQKALIGQACSHPIDVCMVLSPTAGAFDNAPDVRALSQDEALATLARAADAGLVHTVGNSQEGNWYICNCCSCSCGILRGLVELGRANVVARAAFVNQVNQDVCAACGSCVEACQFGALSLTGPGGKAELDRIRCAGCGLCVISCPEGALSLARRPEDEVLPPPASEEEWRKARAAARGIDLSGLL